MCALPRRVSRTFVGRFFVRRSFVRRSPVIRPLLIALLGAAFLSGLSEIKSLEIKPAESRPAGTVVLTAAKPFARVPIPVEVWREKRTSLAISIVAIKNPKNAGFSINVFLEPGAPNEPGAKTNIAPAEIGVLGIYPAGQTGDYRLNASAALRSLQASGADTNQLCLRMELRRIHPKNPLDGLEVMLSAPQWLPAN
jgi:hypothetical protein